MTNLRTLLRHWFAGRRGASFKPRSLTFECLEDRSVPSGLNNSAPIACNNWFYTTHDTTLVVPAPGLLGNDYDADGDALTIRLVRPPTQGVLDLHADGSFKFTTWPSPFEGAGEAMRFAYVVNDGQADSNWGWVSIGIDAYDGPYPLADSDFYTINEDCQLSIAANAGVLMNDVCDSGNPLTARLVEDAAHGAVSMNADGSFDYRPNTDYNGRDQFTYAVSDGVTEGLGTVYLTVNSVLDYPRGHWDKYTIDEDTTLVGNVLANDVSVEGTTLSAQLTAGPWHGNLTFNEDGSFIYRPAANWNEGDGFYYRATDQWGASRDTVVYIYFNPVNDPPRADAGPDQIVNEGATVTFDASGSTDIEGDPLTYTWYLENGVTATGVNPARVYADSGVYTATVLVSDGGIWMSTDTVTITVNNVAPAASLTGPASGVRGQVRAFTLGASDLSPTDQAAGFTYRINWGDGTIDTLNGPAGTTVSHVFTATGAYTVTATATDKDGGISTPVTQAISIKAVDVQAGTLAIGGTTNADTIVVTPNDSLGNLNVKINGISQGIFAPGLTQILVYGQAGNDDIQLASNKIKSQTYYVNVDAILYGDGGDDSLDARGSSANNTLVGGAGNDSLQGGAGRDILLGGLGADVLHGNGGDDILIGNATDFDTNVVALNAIMAEWARNDMDYATRADHLTGKTAGGKNGSYLLITKTIHDDAALDQLYGDAGQDLFFVSAGALIKDKINDGLLSERTVAL